MVLLVLLGVVTIAVVLVLAALSLFFRHPDWPGRAGAGAGAGGPASSPLRERRKGSPRKGSSGKGSSGPGPSGPGSSG